MSDFAIQPAGHGPIHSIRPVHSLSHSQAVGRPDATRFSVDPSAGGDRVELSDMARLLGRMRDMPEVRQERIDALRSAISRGGYDTDDRLDLAIDQLLKDEDLLA